VEIVDAVQVHVLSVPCKAGLPHPKVEVSCVHTRDMYPILPGHGVQDGIQIVDVPFPHARISEGPWNVRTIQWLVEGHILPVFPFQFLIILCFWRFVPEQSIVRHKVHPDNCMQRQEFLMNVQCKHSYGDLC